MFERFTDRARETVVRTQVEAGELRHERIGTEHVLLGLLRGDDRTLVSVLAELGAEPAAVRERLVADLREAA